MKHSELLTAVYTHFQSIADIPQLVFPNVHEKCISGDYVSVGVAPFPSIKTGISGVVRFGGMIYANVHVRDDTGEIKAAEIVDKIAASFPFGTVLSFNDVGIRIDEAPAFGQGIQVGDGHYMIRVSIIYNRTCSAI